MADTPSPDTFIVLCPPFAPPVVAQVIDSAHRGHIADCPLRLSAQTGGGHTLSYRECPSVCPSAAERETRRSGRAQRRGSLSPPPTASTKSLERLEYFYGIRTQVHLQFLPLASRPHCARR